MAALAVPAAGQQVELDATPVGDNAQLDASAANDAAAGELSNFLRGKLGIESTLGTC